MAPQTRRGGTQLQPQPQARTSHPYTWQSSVTTTLQTRMDHVQRLFDDAREQLNEHAWYHPCDNMLNFMSQRTNIEGATMSIHPQAPLCRDVTVPKTAEETNIPAAENTTRGQDSSPAAQSAHITAKVAATQTTSAIATRAGGSPPDSTATQSTSSDAYEEKKRYPDFLVHLKLDVNQIMKNRIVFIVEVKDAPDDEWLDLESSLDRAVLLVFDTIRVRKQLLDQVRHDFDMFKDQEIIYGMVIIGWRFRVARFFRDDVLPGSGSEDEYKPEIANFRWLNDAHDLFDSRRSDYSKSFKQWWLRARKAQGVEDPPAAA